MKTVRIVPAMALVAALGLFQARTLPAAEEAYQVDTVHSVVIFKIKHLGIGNAYGRFNELSGTVKLNPEEPEKSAIQVQVKTESVDTGNPKRDQHLKSPDFFAAKEFPLISFKSKEVKKTDENSYEATGDLTLHGVTRPVTVKIARTGVGKDPFGGGTRAGFETTFTIKRSDFGMKTMLNGGVGDDVQITVSSEAVRK
jgi:polyisoprenoid-binding protein YceI